MTKTLPNLKGLLDTSVFVALEQHRELDFGALPVEQFVSVITKGELLAGVLAAKSPEVRAIRIETIESLAGFSMLPVDSQVANRWGELRYVVSLAGRRPNVNDLWIAAIALANSLPVITQVDDFEVIADLCDLTVIKV